MLGLSSFTQLVVDFRASTFKFGKHTIVFCYTDCFP